MNTPRTIEEVARIGWENYHALAVAYTHNDHARNESFMECQAPTCSWAAEQFRAVEVRG